MDPTKLLKTFQQLGLPITSRVSALLIVLVPLVLLIGAWLWKRRGKLFSKVGTGLGRRTDSGLAAPPPTVSGNQLRHTWKRFLRTLPRTYQRSLLGFDQFVVLGDAASGKSQVVDLYTDWRRQAKQFLGSHVFDSHMDIYLGSRTVVTELAPSVLFELGPKCRTALRRLWAPMYRMRSPTVLVVLDMQRAKSPDYDLVDLAERIRGKINLLSHIRNQPLEVRVVLTHLDANEGWDQFAELCRAEKIPLYIPLAHATNQPGTETQLEAWVVRLRDHLSRSLVKQGARTFRQVIGFLRTTQEIPKPLSKFVDALLAPEALSLQPRLGGVYLAAAPAAEPNPLEWDAVTVRGPDPRVQHRSWAFGVGVAALAYLSLAFFTQRGLCLEAHRALANWRDERAAIARFTCDHCELLASRPDFYPEARVAVRQKLSENIRSELLIPNLRKVARDGFVKNGAMPLRVRRTLFYLALIHSDRRDKLGILGDKHLTAWTEMTELDADIIEAYLDVTEQAYDTAIAIHYDTKQDEHDQPQFWASLLTDVSRRLTAETASEHEMAELQKRAAEGADVLWRFEHDDVVSEILDSLDRATDFGSQPRAASALSAAYLPLFRDFASARKAANLNAELGWIRGVLQTIRLVDITPRSVELVSELADRLQSLYSTPARGPAEKSRTLDINGVTYSFDLQRWAELVRNAQANALVSRFLQGRDTETSIFVKAGSELQWSTVRWNATNDGSSIFMGRAEIPRLYTRAAYDALVHDPVIRLERALEHANIPKPELEQLHQYIRYRVRSYAIEYKRHLRSFYDSFALSTPSPEALRVAVAQMAADESPFNAFIRAVHNQVDIDAPGALEPMQQELSEYAGLRKLFDRTGVAELGKYRPILAQLLQDLGPATGTGANGETNSADDAASAATGDTLTLESALSPTGRVALSSLRGDRGSYASLISDWHASLGLPPVQLAPFLAPIFELDRLGVRDVERVVRRAWNDQVAPLVQQLSRKFPFDPSLAAEDATAHEIDELLNPTTGRVASFVRRYLTPLADPRQNQGFHLRQALEQRLSLPQGMVSTVNAASALSAQLYDAKGRASLLALEIATVPFEHGIDPRFGLTLVYLSVGEASVNNFNQKPGLTTIRFDWTRQQISQVGIQLVNLDTQERLFPEPIATPNSSWSALRLLAAAKVTHIKKPEHAELYTWQVRHQAESGRITPVRYVVMGNPLARFSLGTPEPPPVFAEGATR